MRAFLEGADVDGVDLVRKRVAVEQVGIEVESARRQINHRRAIDTDVGAVVIAAQGIRNGRAEMMDDARTVPEIDGIECVVFGGDEGDAVDDQRLGINLIVHRKSGYAAEVRGIDVSGVENLLIGIPAGAHGIVVIGRYVDTAGSARPADRAKENRGKRERYAGNAAGETSHRIPESVE